jgi:hypothetical protein
MSYNSSFARDSRPSPVYGAGMRAVEVDVGLRRYLRPDETLRVHHAARPVAVRLVSVYGAHRHRAGEPRQHLPRLLGAGSQG